MRRCLGQEVLPMPAQNHLWIHAHFILAVHHRSYLFTLPATRPVCLLGSKQGIISSSLTRAFHTKAQDELCSLFLRLQNVIAC